MASSMRFRRRRFRFLTPNSVLTKTSITNLFRSGHSLTEDDRGLPAFVLQDEPRAGQHRPLLALVQHELALFLRDVGVAAGPELLALGERHELFAVERAVVLRRFFF